MISMTDRAIDKVKEFSRQMAEASGKDLRIFIQGVGCSGYSYGFTFDEQRDGDTVVESGDLRVLLDANCAPLLSGAEVDFVDDERGAGFTVDNPNPPPSCGPTQCSGCG